jgi:hypothetical protein
LSSTAASAGPATQAMRPMLLTQPVQVRS